MERPTIFAPTDIDLATLDAALGSNGLCGDPQTGLITVAEGSPVTQAQLEAAVASYVPPPPPAVPAAPEPATPPVSVIAALLDHLEEKKVITKGDRQKIERARP